MDATMAEKAQCHYVLEVIQSLTVSPSEVVAFGSNATADLAKEMLT
jgi:hypothetical protein